MSEMYHKKPLAIDLYAGLGGWTEGLLAEGYRVVGFDIERHVYGEARYPAQLVLQDVLTIHGRQFASAQLIVASPPCQAYSYRAMPWKRAKALPPPDNSLFEACFRIQREASEAAGRYIPLVVENVRGAQKWVGRAKWHFGSFYLWGDVPALMPMTKRAAKVPGLNWSGSDKPGYVARAFNTTAEQRLREQHGTHRRRSSTDAEECSLRPAEATVARSSERLASSSGSDRSVSELASAVPRAHCDASVESLTGTKNTGGSWFAVAHNTTSGHSRNPDGREAPSGTQWFNDGPRTPNSLASMGGKSSARKAASAHIAKIPILLARHIARAWKETAA